MARIMEYPEANTVGPGDKLIIDGAAGTRSVSFDYLVKVIIDRARDLGYIS